MLGGQRPPKRPRAIWYLVPVVVAALSVTAFAVLLGTQADRLNAADADEQVGEVGSVSALDLAEGHRYFVFHAADETLVDTPTCTLQAAGGPRVMPLAPPSEVDDWTYDESREWILVGSFRAPVTNPDSAVACRALTGGILVRPDDRAFAVLGMVGLLMVIGLLVAVGLLVLIIVLRYRSSRPLVAWQPSLAWPHEAYPPVGPYPPASPHPPAGPQPPAGW
jgi:hypothetical protein